MPALDSTCGPLPVCSRVIMCVCCFCLALLNDRRVCGASELVLNGNQISGSIPDGIGGVTSMQYLYLAGNAITGSIPSTIGSLTSMAYVSQTLCGCMTQYCHFSNFSN